VAVVAVGSSEALDVRDQAVVDMDTGARDVAQRDEAALEGETTVHLAGILGMCSYG
jgi:hypothetical protein